MRCPSIISFAGPLMLLHLYSASDSLLEAQMSSLDMWSRQGSLDEARLKAATSLLAYPNHKHLLPQKCGYASPASTISPVGSPHAAHGKDPGPFGLRTGENTFGCDPVRIH